MTGIRLNPAMIIALICGTTCLLLFNYLKLDSNTSLLLFLTISITLCIFLMWKYPRSKYWYKARK